MSRQDSLKAQIEALLPELRRYSLAQVRNMEAAEELVSDTLATAYAQLDKINPLMTLRDWLFAILRSRFHARLANRHAVA